MDPQPAKHGIGRYVQSWEDSGLLVLWPSLSAPDHCGSNIRSGGDEPNLLKTAATRTKAPIDAASTSTHGMMCENATHSRRMMEAAVQSGSAGISGPLGSVPPGKKGRADSLLNTSAIVARRSFQALPPSGLSSVVRWIENMSRATVISLKLRKTLMCVTGGRAAQGKRRCLQREAAVSGSVAGWRIAARRRAAGRRRRRARRYP